jgi:hypothetical protein
MVHPPPLKSRLALKLHAWLPQGFRFAGRDRLVVRPFEYLLPNAPRRRTQRAEFLGREVLLAEPSPSVRDWQFRGRRLRLGLRCMPLNRLKPSLSRRRIVHMELGGKWLRPDTNFPLALGASKIHDQLPVPRHLRVAVGERLPQLEVQRRDSSLPTARGSISKHSSTSRRSHSRRPSMR